MLFLAKRDFCLTIHNELDVPTLPYLVFYDNQFMTTDSSTPRLRLYLFI